jgi:hypothetical protein
VYVVAFDRATAAADHLERRHRPKLPVSAEARVELERKWAGSSDQSLPGERPVRLAAGVLRCLPRPSGAAREHPLASSVSLLELLVRARPERRGLPHSELLRSGRRSPQVHSTLSSRRAQAAA